MNSPRDAAEISRRAAAAAAAVAGRLAGAPITALVLNHSRHITVLVRPLNVIARVLCLTPERTVDALDRELAIARHLGSRGAPAVTPTDRYPAGPHVHDGFAMTLWPYFEHALANQEDPAHLRRAARALHQLHAGLADLPLPLPSYLTRVEECGALLADRSKLPVLAAADRDTLLSMYERLMARLARCPVRPVPLHGDPHLGNVLFTDKGPLWTDFETVCRGPVEWDLHWLPDACLLEPIHRECQAVLHLIRSLCVSTWCWAEPHLPGKLDAARYHLSHLRRRLHAERDAQG